MNPIKIAYVLVSSEKDYFLEQTILSAYSVRRYNPNAEIVVVADTDTISMLIKERAKLKEYITDIISVDVPEVYNMMQRSRFLKTNLPEYVSGDFIYMDSDTVVSGSLADIYNGVNDLGLIRDENLEEYSADTKNWIRSNCEMMGWPDLSEEIGYNGGVIVFRRTTKAEDFFHRWHENWKECRSKGYDRDQLALTKANKECCHVFKELDGKYNCQIAKFEADRFKSDARIFHYYDVSNCYHIYNDLKVWNKFKTQYVIPQEFLDAINNTQNLFASRYVKAYGLDIELLCSEWRTIYTEYPMIRMFAQSVLIPICKLWGRLRKIKNNM